MEIHLFTMLAWSALVPVAVAQGAVQLSCSGFPRYGSDYNVEMVYGGVQSLDSICNSFKNALNNHKWCNPQGLNCRTSQDGGLVAFGISVNDLGNGFSCLPAAFVQALQAQVGSGPPGSGCIDLTTSWKPQKRSLDARGTPPPPAGQGVEYFVGSRSNNRIYLANVADGNQFVYFPYNYYADEIPGIARYLGTTGLNLNTHQFTVGGAYSVYITFDAGINNGPGSINQAQWQEIITSVFQRMREINQNGRSNRFAGYYVGRNGVTLLSIDVLFVFQPLDG